MRQKSVENISTLSLRQCQCCLVLLQDRMKKKKKDGELIVLNTLTVR